MSLFQADVFQPGVFQLTGDAVAPVRKQQPAGRAKRERKRRVILGDRAHFVTESELGALLEAWLARGDAPVRRKANRPSVAAPPPRIEPEPLPAPIVEMQARYVALAPQLAPDWRAELDRVWRSLRERWEREEDDVTVLFLV